MDAALIAETVDEAATLRAVGQAKPSHPAFAFKRGLMAVFGAIVHACAGLDEHALGVCEFRDFRFRGGTVAQLVGDDFFRPRRIDSWLTITPRSNSSSSVSRWLS